MPSGIFSILHHVHVFTDCDVTSRRGFSTVLTSRVQGARQRELVRAAPGPLSCGRKQVGAYKEFCLLILRSETWVSSLGHRSTTQSHNIQHLKWAIW